MTEDYMKRWEEERRKAQQDLRSTKDSLMPILNSLGIHYVVISYNGYGDSGQIEDIAVYGPGRKAPPDDTYDDDCRIEIPDAVVTLPEATGQKLKQFLDDYGWRLAYDTNPGFENNEGGQGTILIDVDERRITIEHGNNYVEVHTSTHEIA